MKEAINLADDTVETIQSLVSRFQPEKSILSSVIEHNPAMEELLGSVSKFHKLSHLTKVAFTTPVGKPKLLAQTDWPCLLRQFIIIRLKITW